MKRSFRELGAAAKAISDAAADESLAPLGRSHRGAFRTCACRSAAKLYLAVREDLDADPAIGAAGINCLNESHFSRHHPLPGLERALTASED